MRNLMNREFLLRRIDRCYLIAAGSRRDEKRALHLELARYYRKMLSALGEHPSLALMPAR